ncbi:MAG TPA: hypothetical protein IAB87_06055 [Candidatus Coprenecus merdipullorum]|nr:hypothetical protein [Candidatus Coprenecus merdipullorum]
MRKTLIIALLLIIIPAGHLSAQFATGMGGGTSSSGSGSQTDSTIQSYTLKRYFSSLAHRDSMSVGWAFGGSVILPGTAQIYNKQYWKLPIIYGGLGGMIGGGIYYNSQFKKTGNESDKITRNLFFIGAAVFYWGQMLDGAVSYKSYRDHLPGRATIYSILCPGLGQIYNKEYWKLPIYYGGLAVAGYFWYYNDIQYKRFQKDYNAATTPGGNYEGSISVDNLQYYRDYYRRYRDYSIVATVLIYLLQVIDADVFATMSTFDVNQNLSMDIQPAVIQPLNYDFTTNYTYAMPTGSAIGVQMNFKF